MATRSVYLLLQRKISSHEVKNSQWNDTTDCHGGYNTNKYNAVSAREEAVVIFS